MAGSRTSKAIPATAIENPGKMLQVELVVFPCSPAFLHVLSDGLRLGCRPHLCYLGAGENHSIRAVTREGIPMASNGIPRIDIAPMLAGDPVGERRIAEPVRDALETIGFFSIGSSR